MPQNVYWQRFSILIFSIISSISIVSFPTKNLALSLLLVMTYTVSTASRSRTLNVPIQCNPKYEANHFSISQGPRWLSQRVRWWGLLSGEFLVGRWGIGNLGGRERENRAFATGHVSMTAIREHKLYFFSVLSFYLSKSNFHPTRWSLLNFTSVYVETLLGQE